MTAIYLEKTAYDRLIEQLMKTASSGILICPATGRPEDTPLKEALGVFGDIWPETIKADAEQHGHA